MDIRKNADFMAMWAYVHAVRREKTRNDMTHEEIYNGIKQELEEFKQATDAPSEHLPQFSQRQEELADIILACMTELCKECMAKNNGYNPADVLVAKNEYNAKRKRNNRNLPVLREVRQREVHLHKVEVCYNDEACKDFIEGENNK